MLRLAVAAVAFGSVAAAALLIWERVNRGGRQDGRSRRWAGEEGSGRSKAGTPASGVERARRGPAR